MWIQFFADILFSIAIIFIPGYLLCRTAQFPKIVSLASAPFVSCLLLFSLSFILLNLNIAGSWLIVVGPLFGISFGVFLVRLFIGRRMCSSKRTNRIDANNRNLVILALYVLVGLIVGALYLVKAFDGAGSFAQQYDNYYHLNLIRQYLETGYYAQAGILDYPAAWHCLVAVVASFGAGDLCVALNAVNYVLVAVVLPSGMFLFLHTICGQNTWILIAGSICSLAFAPFPWGFIAFGPLYPNLLSFVVLPAVMSLFAQGFLETSIRKIICNFIAFAIGCISLIVMHPGAIFAGILLMSPFVVSRIWNAKLKRQWLSRKTARLLFSLGFLCFVGLVWIVCYKLPAFQGTVLFTWPAYLSTSDAIINALLINWTPYCVPQFLLSLLVFAGVVRCIVKRRGIWLVASYIAALVILVTVQSTEGILKHVLGGFWYTDKFRIAAIAALAGIPLAAIGLSAVAVSMHRMLEKIKVKRKDGFQYLGAFIIAVAVALYFPNYDDSSEGIKKTVVTPFGNVYDLIAERNSLSEEAIFSQEEVDFAFKVKDVVSKEALIANVPFDGSYLSSGVVGLNIAYKALESAAYWDGVTDPEGMLIRANLCNYMDDPATYDAVRNSGIRYVLLFDIYDKDGERMYDAAQDLSLWSGITDISDDTPGFEIVLAEDDMRLYRLTAF